MRFVIVFLVPSETVTVRVWPRRHIKEEARRWFDQYWQAATRSATCKPVGAAYLIIQKTWERWAAESGGSKRRLRRTRKKTDGRRRRALTAMWSGRIGESWRVALQICCRFPICTRAKFCVMLYKISLLDEKWKQLAVSSIVTKNLILTN